MRKTRFYTTAVTTLVLALAGAGAAAPAQAAGGDGVQRAGSCSGRSLWDLKAKHDNRRVGIEFSVDSNVVGQGWRVRITDNRRVVLAGIRVTGPRSGSLSADRRTTNRPGTDRIRAVARNPRTGEVCRGRVNL